MPHGSMQYVWNYPVLVGGNQGGALASTYTVTLSNPVSYPCACACGWETTVYRRKHAIWIQKRHSQQHLVLDEESSEQLRAAFEAAEPCTVQFRCYLCKDPASHSQLSRYVSRTSIQWLCERHAALSDNPTLERLPEAPA